MEEDDEVDSTDSNSINEEVKMLRERLAHLDNEVQRVIETTLMDKSIVATSLDDLRPAEVPIKHHFPVRQYEADIPFCKENGSVA